MTRSTAMYHTGKDPVTGGEVLVPFTYAEKKAQKRMLQPAPPVPDQEGRGRALRKCQ